MAKPCPSKCGVLNVRMRSRATNGLTALLGADCETQMPSLDRYGTKITFDNEPSSCFEEDINVSVIGFFSINRR